MSEELECNICECVILDESDIRSCDLCCNECCFECIDKCGILNVCSDCQKETAAEYLGSSQC